MKRKKSVNRKHEFLMFTTAPPDLQWIDSPCLSELERACGLNGKPEVFGQHLEAENRIWTQLDCRLREIDRQKHFFQMNENDEYEPYEFKPEIVKRQLSVPFQCRIHAMRIELMAQMQEEDRPC